MKDWFLDLVEKSKDSLTEASLTVLVLFLTYVSLKLFKSYITATASKHNLAEHRTASISKVGQSLIYLISIAIISNVIGSGIQGIFVLTSSLFAVIGVAFFANWSILSNVTASVLLYFTFPYRIGDRISIENEPKFTGILKDVTIMYLKIKTDGGSYITLPANVAIQKLIIIQSEADYQKALKEAQVEKADI